MSGSGKGSVLRALEDLGYYSVDNLPVELIPTFAELVRDSATIRRAALVVDVREGSGLRKFPAIYRRIRKSVNTRLLFLEADDESLMRRFSETRRPHPLSTEQPIDGQHCQRARHAGSDPGLGRPYHQHLEVQRSRSS